MRQSLETRFQKWLGKLGPGIITGASDDDPSGILTYLQAGVVLGFHTLWTALMTLPLMYGIQEMCGRIGLVTNRGLMRLVKERYPASVAYPIAAITGIVITINVGVDLLAVGAVMEHLFGVTRLFWIPAVAAFIATCMVFFSYERFARGLKWLTASLLFYVATVFFLDIDWSAALRATVTPSFTWSKENILLVAAILGTTISPYLFFWQAGEEIEEKNNAVQHHTAKRFIITKRELRILKQDTFAGMLLSNTATWFIIAAGAGVAQSYGIAAITNFDEAAAVFQPILGNAAYAMFAAGIIGTGLLAIPVLSGSVGYILAETLGWREGIHRRFHEARGFYATIVVATLVGMALTLAGFDPIKLLIYTAVFYALVTPPLVYLIMKLGNDPHLMKERVNGALSNALGFLTFIVTGGAAIAYLVSLVPSPS